MATDWTGEDLLKFCSFLDIRVLLTAAELNLFSVLAVQARTARDVATELGAEERPLSMVLDALAAMELLAKKDDAYSCPPQIARYLSESGDETVLPMLRHQAGMWERVSRLTAVVRGPNAGSLPAMTEEESTRAFIEAMHVRAKVNAESNVAAMDISGFKRLIDVGGASGSYTVAILKNAPEMTATLFDRPSVVAMARARFAAEGLTDRVSVVAGDFEVDPLPPGHDLALVSAIIHQNSREENVALFKNVFGALFPGGRLIVRDHVMSPDHTSPRSGAIFAINMLVSTPGGGTYTFVEIREDMERAGFQKIRLLRGDAEMECLVEAFKP
jgi:predicted O-methyltransferase YrrM